jgi:xanthine dehydrogenase YagR molybdenum-binding subunit
MSKEFKLKVGVEKNLKDLIVEVPDDQPKPWDGAIKLKYIGGRTSRIDGIEKTTGRARYTFDIKRPGMLYGKILRSPYPACLVKQVDVSAAERMPGVKAVILVQEDLPMQMRYAGQEILAVAAETPEQAAAALKAIKVDYEKKDFVVDLERAMSPDAPVVFSKIVKEEKTEGDLPGSGAAVSQEGNIRGPKVSPEGADPAEIDALLKSSDFVVEAEYRTQVQTHSSMETHGVVAEWEDDQKLMAWVSTQGTFGARNEFADYFNLKKTDVRVITEYMGGGFGSKFGVGVEGIMAARLAKKAQAPVRMMLDRKEEHLAVGNRPNSIQKLTIGAGKDGKLTGIKLISYGTAGVGTGAGTSGPAGNIYQYQKFYAEESDVFINAGAGRAFRAPGHPQGTFALEQAIDQLAYNCKIDPLEFRRINTLNDEVRQTEYKLGAEKSGWAARNPVPGGDPGPVKRGIGVANSVWYYIYGTGFLASVQINSDGSVLFTNGVQDIGGGIGTVLAMVVAEELGLEVKDITVRIGDTNFGLGPASGGSQTTSGITPAARNAAYKAKLKMFELAAGLLEAAPEDLSSAEGKIFVSANPERHVRWKEVAARIPGDQFTVVAERVKDNHELKRGTIAGVQFAEVEVDTETGVISVKRVVAVHDCGRPMDRLTIENQINGGITQGISYALFEDRILDRNTGLMVNANLDQYKIAGSLDIPEIESVIIDVNHGMSSTGAMGIGEPATIPTAAAIANAVYHATGVRIYQIPMTPARVLSALQAAKGGAR